VLLVLWNARHVFSTHFAVPEVWENSWRGSSSPFQETQNKGQLTESLGRENANIWDRAKALRPYKNCCLPFSPPGKGQTTKIQAKFGLK
jgi:hypothetical protein